MPIRYLHYLSHFKTYCLLRTKGVLATKQDLLICAEFCIYIYLYVKGLDKQLKHQWQNIHFFYRKKIL